MADKLAKYLLAREVKPVLDGLEKLNKRLDPVFEQINGDAELHDLTSEYTLGMKRAVDALKVMAKVIDPKQGELPLGVEKKKTDKPSFPVEISEVGAGAKIEAQQPVKPWKEEQDTSDREEHEKLQSDYRENAKQVEIREKWRGIPKEQYFKDAPELRELIDATRPVIEDAIEAVTLFAQDRLPEDLIECINFGDVDCEDAKLQWCIVLTLSRQPERWLDCCRNRSFERTTAVKELIQECWKGAAGFGSDGYPVHYYQDGALWIDKVTKEGKPTITKAELTNVMRRSLNVPKPKEWTEWKWGEEPKNGPLGEDVREKGQFELTRMQSWRLLTEEDRREFIVKFPEDTMQIFWQTREGVSPGMVLEQPEWLQVDVTRYDQDQAGILFRVMGMINDPIFDGDNQLEREFLVNKHTMGLISIRKKAKKAAPKKTATVKKLDAPVKIVDSFFEAADLPADFQDGMNQFPGRTVERSHFKSGELISPKRISTFGKYPMNIMQMAAPIPVLHRDLGKDWLLFSLYPVMWETVDLLEGLYCAVSAQTQLPDPPYIEWIECRVTGVSSEERCIFAAPLDQNGKELIEREVQLDFKTYPDLKFCFALKGNKKSDSPKKTATVKRKHP